jgi:hypothetical protein
MSDNNGTETIMLTDHSLQLGWNERRKPLTPRLERRRRTAGSVFVVAVASFVLAAGPAWAHGGSSDTEGYLIVQQAISYLVNEPGPLGTGEALERVKNVLAADDQDGVDIELVQQAAAELEAGKADEATSLLQESISEAIAELSPATGDQTGTTTVLPPLEGNGALSGLDWILLGLSAVLLLAGGGLAYLFRPQGGLSALGNDIRTAGTTPHDPISTTPTGGDHHAH